MEFAVTFESESEVKRNLDKVITLTQELSEEINKVDFGDGLQNFYIGFVCIKTRPGYEGWFKERKPRFKKVHRTSDHLGNKIELKNMFSYDIKFDGEEFDAFCSSSKIEALNMFGKRLIDSLSKLDHLKTRTSNFKLEEFREHLSILISNKIKFMPN